MPLNIVILGAGAIGSLLGSALAQHHHVTLLCRPSHAHTITHQGLTITGYTHQHTHLTAVDTVNYLPTSPDIVLITVKAYDTHTIVQKTQTILQKTPYILSIQNGISNLETIATQAPNEHIFGGITTHGALFSHPGIIEHTGKGQTRIGSYFPIPLKKSQYLARILTSAGIHTLVSKNIHKDIWKKAIINSSINPLTTLLQCPNGYLLKNPILENLIEQICTESTAIANTQQFNLSTIKMIQQTKKVIQETAQNHSSMLQSIKQHRPTEIDYINGAIIRTAQQTGKIAPLNTLLTSIIHKLTTQQHQQPLNI